MRHGGEDLVVIEKTSPSLVYPSWGVFSVKNALCPERQLPHHLPPLSHIEIVITTLGPLDHT